MHAGIKPVEIAKIVATAAVWENMGFTVKQYVTQELVRRAAPNLAPGLPAIDRLSMTITPVILEKGQDWRSAELIVTEDMRRHSRHVASCVESEPPYETHVVGWIGNDGLPRMRDDGPNPGSHIVPMQILYPMHLWASIGERTISGNEYQETRFIERELPA
jgi:hypothetical protein